MLINFNFKNYRSFYDEAQLSMEAVSDNTLRELNTFTVDERLMTKGKNELLKSSIIFGSNASGKSNVLKALAYMKNMIVMSASQFPIINRNEPYLFFEESLNEPTEFEVEIIQNNTFYRYGFSICNGVVLSEKLERRSERLTTLFARQGDNIDIVGLSKNSSKLIKISPTALFLSVGNNFNLDIGNSLIDVLTWFHNLLIIFENNANSLDIYTLNNGKYREQALEILQKADIGVQDMKVKKSKVANMNDFNDVLRFNAQLQIDPVVNRGQFKQEASDLYNIDMDTSFDVYDKNYVKKSKRNIMLLKNSGFHSEGTERLLMYLGWILAALDTGRVILIDELDSKLHFLVADYILRLFNSIDKNPNNAQLVCTAHNVLLMDEDLRRDQIYFTSKSKYGESQIFSLSDFNNVRKNDLFSKKYLAGFYADLPDMDND